MTIGSALKFVNRIKKENDFRKKLYTYNTAKELNLFLAAENMAFTQEDFEDAIQKNRVEAQFEEIANEYSEIKEWWNMLSNSLH